MPEGLPGASSGAGPKYKRGRGRSFFKEQPKGMVCQVPGCERGLHKSRAYYKRYKICSYHVELPCMVVEGQTIRFCQQCGRFQLLSDFEGDRRSCRLKLGKHNARRRRAELDAKTLLELGGESDGGWAELEGPPGRRSGASEASSDMGGAASTLTFTDPAAGLLAGLSGGLGFGPPLSRLISDGRHPPRPAPLELAQQAQQQAQQMQQQQPAQAQQMQQQQPSLQLFGSVQLSGSPARQPAQPLRSLPAARLLPQQQGAPLQQQVPLHAVLALSGAQDAARQQPQQQPAQAPPQRQPSLLTQQSSFTLPLLPQPTAVKSVVIKPAAIKPAVIKPVVQPPASAPWPAAQQAQQAQRQPGVMPTIRLQTAAAPVVVIASKAPPQPPLLGGHGGAILPHAAAPLAAAPAAAPAAAAEGDPGGSDKALALLALAGTMGISNEELMRALLGNDAAGGQAAASPAPPQAPPLLASVAAPVAPWPTLAPAAVAPSAFAPPQPAPAAPAAAAPPALASDGSAEAAIGLLSILQRYNSNSDSMQQTGGSGGPPAAPNGLLPLAGMPQLAPAAAGAQAAPSAVSGSQAAGQPGVAVPPQHVLQELCRGIFQCPLEQLPWNVRQQFEVWAAQQAGKLLLPV
ncbi:squamosa promoter binding [Chlorella sorokiniana]|uniref:Squamosa promoter binding n=1 Tax=Chlorella sorokiniana TaxID=3076 RepID=A0A2P6TNA1_CHLSO|nr:squamosa promoter binding [Chlorella sorokiniana]|eukprot:PRW50811.1 squamosa promoter binding [Chlorella sorokiniana]